MSGSSNGLDDSGRGIFSPSAAFGLRSLFARVTLIVLVTAIPILGTSYVLVSQVASDITMARAEQATLHRFDRILDLFTRLERLQDAVEDADAAGVASARTDTARALGAARDAYERPGETPEARAYWARLGSAWARAERVTTEPNVEAIIATLRDVGAEVENESELDLDPSSAVQYLADAMLRHEPRSIVDLRQTGAAVAAAGRSRLDLGAAELIAARRAVEQQALAGAFSDIASVTSIDPALEPAFARLVPSAKARTSAFEGHVGDVLARVNRDPRDAQASQTSDRLAVDTHLALWRAARVQAGRLVLARLDEQIVRLRIAIAAVSLTIGLATLAVLLVSRNMARRDRAELAAAILEADRLRAELTRISVERALRLQEAQFQTIFENADLGIAIFDRHGRRLQHNGAVEDMLGASTEAVLDSRVSMIVRFDLSIAEPFTLDEYRLGPGDRPQWLSLTYSGVYDEGVCQMVILLIRDATEEKLLAAQLVYDASHDSLTGLANRAAFEQALGEGLSSGAEFAPFALMYIDLDNFKPINDTYGHRAGDHVLSTVAERLRSVVAARDFCARLGGDEFAILLRGLEDPVQIGLIAQRVATAVALPIAYREALELSVTASIGVAIGSPDDRSSDELKHDADIALYAVKERGRNGYHIVTREREPHPVV